MQIQLQHRTISPRVSFLHFPVIQADNLGRISSSLLTGPHMQNRLTEKAIVSNDQSIQVLPALPCYDVHDLDRLKYCVHHELPTVAANSLP